MIQLVNRPDGSQLVSVDIHVVAHTHWDREWYHTAVRFRQGLVALIDDVLDRARGGAPGFLLDGQTVILDDYLSVRPERREELAAALSNGALEAGPWYVLADNLIPSGEAILRNLEAGRRAMRALRSVAPPVMYCPDSFGHPAAVPMIAHEYGFELVIAWRGVLAIDGGGVAVDTARWRAADGNEVLLYHLPPDGYETGSSLPIDPVLARERWRRLLTTLRARSNTGVVLLPSGADHHAAQPDLDDALAAARAVVESDELQVRVDRWHDALRVDPAPAGGISAPAGAVRIHRSTLRDAARAIVLRARATDSEVHSSDDGGLRRFAAAPALTRLPVMAGELRDSYGYTWTLQGTFATRAHLKRENARLERALRWDAEPWLALGWLHPVRSAGNDSRPGNPMRAASAVGMAQLPALLRSTWETLLRTHPHDTLCGCAIDDVARAMQQRQRDVESSITGLRTAALQTALDVDPAKLREQPIEGVAPIVIRNRTARDRSGIAELTVIETLAHVPVGPGSASGEQRVLAGPTQWPPWLADAQRLGSRVDYLRRESPLHYPDNDRVRLHRVVAPIGAVPAMGVRIIAPHRVAESIAVDDMATARAEGGAIVLANGRLTVRIANGRVDVTAHGRTLHDALSFELARDRGDTYTPSIRGKAARLRLTGARIVHVGPYRAEAEIRCSVRSRVRGTKRRDGLALRCRLRLDALSDVVMCDLRVHNRMRDVRLRASWRTDVDPPARVYADAAFGPVERADLTTKSTPAEHAPPTMPLHRWIVVAGERRSVCVFSDGLAEAEPNAGSIAVTLIRAVGELSRSDLPERPGHAGWPASTPEAQCIGVHRARLGLSVLPVWTDETLADVERMAEDFLLPLAGESWRALSLPHPLNSAASHLGAEPEHVRSGPALTGHGVVASAVALTTDDDGLVLRALNVTSMTQRATWTIPGNRYVVTRARADETPIETLSDVDVDPMGNEAKIMFTLAPRALVTLVVRRADR